MALHGSAPMALCWRRCEAAIRAAIRSGAPLRSVRFALAPGLGSGSGTSGSLFFFGRPPEALPCSERLDGAGILSASTQAITRSGVASRRRFRRSHNVICARGRAGLFSKSARSKEAAAEAGMREREAREGRAGEAACGRGRAARPECQRAPGRARSERTMKQRARAKPPLVTSDMRTMCRARSSNQSFPCDGCNPNETVTVYAESPP